MVENNKEASQLLKVELIKLGLNVTDGYGESKDGNWREDSFFAYPVDQETTLKLCCDFRQNAMVYVSSDALPELLLHPVFFNRT